MFTAALETRTMSSGLKLWDRRFHLNSRKHFLTVRAVGRWNKLPPRVVKSPSLKVLGGDWMSPCQERVISRRWGAGLNGP